MFLRKPKYINSIQVWKKTVPNWIIIVLYWQQFPFSHLSTLYNWTTARFCWQQEKHHGGSQGHHNFVWGRWPVPRSFPWFLLPWNIKTRTVTPRFLLLLLFFVFSSSLHSFFPFLLVSHTTDIYLTISTIINT